MAPPLDAAAIEARYCELTADQTIDPLAPGDLIAQALLAGTWPEDLAELIDAVHPGADRLASSPDAVADFLLSLRRAGFGELIENLRAKVLSARCEAIYRAVNTPNGAGPSVVFVAEKPYFMILRESIALRNRGLRTYLLATKAIPVHLRDCFEAGFDGILDGLHAPAHLAEVVGVLRPTLFHIQCWMFGYHIARMVMENAGDVPCVSEFYDISSAVMPREALCRMLAVQGPSEAKVDTDLAMERHIFRHANGVVHRLSEDVIAEVKTHHGSDVPSLRFFPYPLKRYGGAAGEKFSAKSGRTHLVFAGAVHPTTTRPEFSPIALMHEMFGSLLAQGFAVDLLEDPNRRFDRADPGYGAYMRLESEYPRFRVLDGAPPDRLSEVLCRYDFGINLTDFHPGALKNREMTMRGTMGTKPFAYLEAGLPVLVSAEWQAMACLVADNGIGLVLDLAARHDLNAALSGVSYGELAANVRRYNEANDMNRRIGDLLDFYGALCGKALV